jgi:hypothetical protein
MRVLRVVPVATLAALALSAVGCAGESGDGSGSAAPKTEQVRAEIGSFSAANFERGRSTTIDNPWWTLKPGTQFTWTGHTDEDGEKLAHRIVFTVTDLVKTIQGVDVLVGWDRDFSGGELVETELIFLAQDRRGNVWHLGQYSEIYEGEEFVGATTWIVGHLKGAKAGILMLADPKAGSPAYSEGFAPPPYFWDDMGKVAKTGQKTCVPQGCHQGVMIIDEWERGIPDAFQTKWYARGVGLVRVGWRGDDASKEELVLNKIVTLSAAELAKARAEALKLEARANVYGTTQPSRRRAS